VHATHTQAYPGPKTPEALQAFAAELDQIKADTMAKVGSEDARYIIRLLWVIRAMESAGRALLMTSPWLPTWWLGACMLGLSKCLQNMEFGHNVMHGQYEWMNDPRVDGKTHEWDLAGNKEDWRHTHNYMHHHYTNVLEKDRDFGYGMLRLSADVPWEIRFLWQAPYAIVVMVLFEWAIAIHNMEVERMRDDREAIQARIKALWPGIRAKMWMQIKKDYILWPLIGGLVSLALGAGFLKGLVAVMLGNALANVIRNVWSFVVIFCGHFTDGAHTFDPSTVEHETKGHWYLRQILGSSNLTGGKLFHILSGNLSHQIEHHLFPDMPGRRYAEAAVRVREVCVKYGLPYNTGPMPLQMWSVARRIVRHSFPGGEHTMTVFQH
jgi:fatty acid desaturase